MRQRQYTARVERLRAGAARVTSATAFVRQQTARGATIATPNRSATDERRNSSCSAILRESAGVAGQRTSPGSRIGGLPARMAWRDRLGEMLHLA
jgi:hypothetical protein